VRSQGCSGSTNCRPAGGKFGPRDQFVDDSAQFVDKSLPATPFGLGGPLLCGGRLSSFTRFPPDSMLSFLSRSSIFAANDLPFFRWHPWLKVLVMVFLLVFSVTAYAANVALDATDPAGSSSFANAFNWNHKSVPSLGGRSLPGWSHGTSSVPDRSPAHLVADLYRWSAGARPSRCAVISSVWVTPRLSSMLVLILRK